ncbi:substrate-binding domain-containing protein [Hoeflea prorocentri]|uniref:Substrate-binding domain-containing protein n=1 Tax=Hoeflea prorocentri TaxID=1922333 RepID=A0A9X3UKG5_9HYPH|nr:substrate-binding domain-containing protein [Hoeflea prorocentri]MCY6382192.1 substrate-binding domain-containing protein [Hoeflea prorocentri]MDA5399992.1 substrate-binding domain-containing protein [Hoeflea prorocentri]
MSNLITKGIKAFAAAAVVATGLASVPASADEITVGVSWYKFADERWKIDEAGIKSVVEAAGGKYISADANFSPEKSVADVENLITRGADVLIIMSGVADAIGPTVKAALDEGIPVVAYDQLIEVPGTFYVSFDARSVGKELAAGMLAVAPEGNYAIIKGDDGDPNTHQMFGAYQDVMKPKYDSGAIKVVGEQFVDSWRPETAKDTIEQILTANNNDVQAVMVMNDGMASGVAQALSEQGLEIPLSGQDGAPGALNRIARGEQTFTIWKNAFQLGEAAATVALTLAKGEEVANKIKFSGGPQGVELDAMLLPVDRIDASNLDKTIDVGWATKERVCAGVTDNPPAVCQ